MAASTRHLLRQNLRDAPGRGGADEGPASRGLAANARRRRSSQQSSTYEQSHAVLDALSDAQSEFARFLFAGAVADRLESDDDKAGADAATLGDMPSMGSMDAGFMALALEPMERRNERLIMLFEAYALFGALFMQGVWIIYEWGSWKSFGGDGSNYVVERVFEGVMAIALGCNVLLAMWGAMFWINAINVNSSHEEYAFESIKPLVYLQYLLLGTVHAIIVGLLLGIYLNLSPYWPETAIALSIIAVLVLGGMWTCSRHQLACCPLEIYHIPLHTRLMVPHYWIRRKREEFRAGVKIRAQKLRKRAYGERNKVDPNLEPNANGATGSVAKLLRTAAENLGEADCDTSAYVARLAADWFKEADHLRNRSVECLSKYMPLRLAEEVHKLLLVASEQTE